MGKIRFAMILLTILMQVTFSPPFPVPVVQAQTPFLDNPNPPESPVKLIFIHHSTGGNWLADVGQHAYAGGLGRALMQNNYYVSATNYGWGPDGIGDRTDIPNWPEWFTGDNRQTILEALYSENGQNFGDYGTWPRLVTDPGGENQIILFKSCFPNSDLYGAPNDPPAAEPNDEYTVSNAKAVYNKLLTYFATRQDKLFVLITAPPLMRSETEPDRAANARAVNNWLVNDWLADYPYPNVAVFDLFNGLTSNGGSPQVNDAGKDSGNHHRWWKGKVQHVQPKQYDFSAYYTDDSHPSNAGGSKATTEFIPLLNVFYHRWQAGQEAVFPIAQLPTATITAQLLPSVTPALAITPMRISGKLIQPSELVYRGAFRLPDAGERPLTFAYGGAAMTFNPKGDQAGSNAGFPGSLFIMGHDRLADGQLPNGNQVAEITIPASVIARDVSMLNQAQFIQEFRDVDTGLFTTFDEIPRVGMQYLDTPATGPKIRPKIHMAWGQHLLNGSQMGMATHAWIDPDLSSPRMQGAWYIGNQSPYIVTGYLFEIPAAWADAYAEGRYLATGRYRDGGWSGMGPALFAYRPWNPDSGAPMSPGTHLQEVVLLSYAKSDTTTAIEKSLSGYQHPDEWEGGAWLTMDGGQSAVLFAGTKSVGNKYWYGYVNPAGHTQPCVEEELVDQFTLCRLADGTPCPSADLVECADHNDYRGWWSTAFEAQFILYNPVDLARVAAGEIQPWDPQPYAQVSIDNVLFHNPAGIEPDMLGSGLQRRYRIGDVAYDRQHGMLYVLELYADEAKPVVHVWKIQ